MRHLMPAAPTRAGRLRAPVRVYRGGRFDVPAVAARCADRNNYLLFNPSNADIGIGFRCVRSK